MMKENDLRDVLAAQRSMVAPLNELVDLTVQLADAFSRGDRTSVRMLVAMRNDPLYKVARADDNIRTTLSTLNAEDVTHLRALLAGEVETDDPVERQISVQSVSNRRLLLRVREIDKQVSRRFVGDKSFYKND